VAAVTVAVIHRKESSVVDLAEGREDRVGVLVFFIRSCRPGEVSEELWND
jgi:hypothetical protein